jgi:hypothetical protein
LLGLTASTQAFAVSARLQAQAVTVRTRACRLKAAPDERPEERPEININKMAIVEFHDAKNPKPILGIVQGAEYKAKGGARIQILDASGSMHQVKEAQLHINLGSYKGKLVEPADILKEYETVLQTEPMNLGVEVDELEMAWELCAEASKNFSPKAILSLVDEGFFKSSIDAYRAFRLLTSDVGKIFFKHISATEFKAKALKSVQGSKDQWCRAQESVDWCFL